MKKLLIFSAMLALGKCSPHQGMAKTPSNVTHLYDDVCFKAENGAFSWTGMAKSIIPLVLESLLPEEYEVATTIINVLIGVDDSWNDGSDELQMASTCALNMINEAFNDELLAETKDATSDIAESSGKLRTLLESLPENSFSDDEINFALGYYERIIQMKEAIGRKFAPVPGDATLEKYPEKLLYFYVSALSIQSTAAAAIQAYIDAKITDVARAKKYRDHFIIDIESVLSKEYGNGESALQTIMDNSPFKTQWHEDVQHSEFCGHTVMYGPPYCQVNDVYRNIDNVENLRCTCNSCDHYSCADLENDAQCMESCEEAFTHVQAYVDSQIKYMDKLITDGRDLQQKILATLNIPA